MIVILLSVYLPQCIDNEEICGVYQHKSSVLEVNKPPIHANVEDHYK